MKHISNKTSSICHLQYVHTYFNYTFVENNFFVEILYATLGAVMRTNASTAFRTRTARQIYLVHKTCSSSISGSKHVGCSISKNVAGVFLVNAVLFRTLLFNVLLCAIFWREMIA